MAEPATASGSPDKGPYTSSTVKTIKIAGPIEISFTTTFNASHVPPPPAPSERPAMSGESILNALRPMAEMILQKLDEIQRAQQDPN